MARMCPTESSYAKLADPRCARCSGGASVAKVSATFGTFYRGICPCVPRLMPPARPGAR